MKAKAPGINALRLIVICDWILFLFITLWERYHFPNFVKGAESYFDVVLCLVLLILSILAVADLVRKSE